MVAKKIELLAIVGPTASGKTSLSIEIAKKFNGEIIAADSRTVYKYLDIGTAKPTVKEQSGIKHWALDVVGPGQKFTVASFKELAIYAIKDIRSRGKLPIMVGGSGLYADAVLYDYSFVPENLDYRKKLEVLGNIKLIELIKKQGLKLPENYKNKRYLIRTLEKGYNEPQKKELSRNTLIIGISPPKEILTNRIIMRAKAMIDMGVVDEIKNAYKIYQDGSEALNGGIYKSFKPFINGKISQEEAINNFVASDLKLVKKQYTWFRRNQDIEWYESSNLAYKEIVRKLTIG